MTSSQMDSFMSDMLEASALQGLKYFAFFCRGKEELTTLINPLPSARAISPNVEKDLSVCEGKTYLVTSYYRCRTPYVYPPSKSLRPLRKQHPEANEVPYDLVSTQNWRQRPVRLWVILDELFFFTVKELADAGQLPPDASPTNPFKIDREFFTYPVRRQPRFNDATLYVTTASTIAFLRLVYLGNPKYEREIFEDLQFLIPLHFRLARSAVALSRETRFAATSLREEMERLGIAGEQESAAESIGSTTLHELAAISTPVVAPTSPLDLVAASPAAL
eukprot:gnl/Trimastix_PCT/1919.p1 GENE.gnl/Trimastix_PCT/1919~~gnl/Trimastix_PCT/1919.p1  ORF type:complete len:277 (+),score=64.35 gnl/Trimastix_PCT/1919:96-926(+)